MKKYLLFVAIALLSMYARSQDDELVIRGTKKISRDLTPQQVVDSLNKRFPNAKAIEYYKVPADAAARGWAISKENDLDANETIDYYTISFKRDDLKYYGLFNANGKLIRSKMEESVDKLPDPVKFSVQSLSTQHPGWKVISKKYFRNHSESSQKEYYEVIAQKGDEKRSLYYQEDGTLIDFKKD
jgi:hypothetical protein